MSEGTQAGAPARLFVEVGGEQLPGPFGDLAHCLVAHIELALKRNGATVALHREPANAAASIGHTKGDGCHCKPLAFQVSPPRRIILPGEA